jgi:hypothetical protein
MCVSSDEIERSARLITQRSQVQILSPLQRISAPVDRAWAALTAPGHWVGTGDPTRFDLREGARLVYESSGHGSCPIHIER